MLDRVTFERLTGDRGHDANKLRDSCAEHDAEAVILSKRYRRLPIPHDCEAYKSCRRIENLFCQIKDVTRITLRKDKTQLSYASFALVNRQLCP